ncbi:MAG: MFS transporter [archaeon]
MFSFLDKYPAPLRRSILEGSFAAIMTGGAMAFLVPFAVLLGANTIQIGFLTALPAFLAAWFQLGSIRILEFYKKKKQIVFFSVFVQALSWLAIAALPFIFQSNQVTWLIAIATAGTVIGSLGMPFWQSWMRSLTPRELLGEYFGMRNAIIGFIVFLSTIVCGYLLDSAIANTLLYAFIGIFLAGFVGRLISAYLITKIEEPEEENPPKVNVNIFGYISKLKNKNFGHFILFGTLMSFSIALVAPYVSLYFLDGLGLKNNYLLYTVLISAGTLTTLISLPYWGHVIDKYGSIKLLKATGLLVCFYPLLLFLVRDPFWLICVELIDGVIYSSFNLALANFVYESFKPAQMIKYAALQAILFGTAAFAGAMLSGFLQMLPIAISFLTTPFFVICILSMILRMLSFLLTIWKVKDVRRTKYIAEDALIMRALTFVPITKFLQGNLGVVVGTTGQKISSFEKQAANKIGKFERGFVNDVEKAEITAIEDIRKVSEIAKNKAAKTKNAIEFRIKRGLR